MRHTVPWMAMICGLAMLPAAFGQDDAIATQPAPPEAAGLRMPDDPWSSPDVAAPRMDAKPLYRSAPATSNADDSDGKRSGLPWVRTTLSLGGVVGLIVLLAWGYKAVSGGGSLGLPLRGRGANVIEIISRTALSPKQTICLVRVGPQLLLLGVTNESVRTLHVIEDASLASQLLGMAAQGRPDSQSAEFTRWLSNAAREYTGDADSHEPSETIAPEEQRLSEIKQKLAGTLARLRTKAAGA